MAFFRCSFIVTYYLLYECSRGNFVYCYCTASIARERNNSICYVEATKLPPKLAASILQSCMVNRSLSRQLSDSSSFFNYCAERINNHPDRPDPPLSAMQDWLPSYNLDPAFAAKFPAQPAVAGKNIILPQFHALSLKKNKSDGNVKDK